MTELGNRLKEAREAKGMSLDDLQEATKIQKRYLIGIEEGNYDMMPGKFYVRAFIKQYCEAVGLPAEEIFDQYKNDVPSIANEELPAKLSRVQSRKTVPSGNSKAMELFPKILAGIFILGAAVLIYILIAKNFNASDDKAKEETPDEKVAYEERKDSPLTNDKKDEKSGNKEETTEQQESPAKKAKPEKPKKEQELASVSSSGKNSTYKLKNAEKFTLKVSSTGATWVNIKNGSGKSFFQNTLKENQSQEIDFTNEKEAVIIIGNAADTEVFVNGQKLEYAISPTQTVTQNITIQFAKAK